jgi:hypothetical protein
LIGVFRLPKQAENPEKWADFNGFGPIVFVEMSGLEFRNIKFGGKVNQ